MTQRYRVTVAKKARGTSFRAPEGWEVRVNGSTVGNVSPLRLGWEQASAGWYFVVVDDRLGIPLRNTCGELGVSAKDCKRAAIAYVKQCLTARPTQPSSKEEPK